MCPDAVRARIRLLLGALLTLVVVVAAPTAAQGRWHPHPHPHPHGGGPGGGRDDDEDDAPAPTSAAPATTPAPATTVAPAAPAVVAAPAAAILPAAGVPAPGVLTAAAPPPELGRTVALAAVSGTVTVRAPGGGTLPLTAAVALPTGTRVDTRAGEVELASAVDAAGKTQTGRFSGGVFEVRQPKRGKGMTQIVLVGGHWADCKTSNYVSRAAARKKARKPIRKLWGSDDHGQFQTRGGGSVATVRGTRWLTSDTCNGTRTTVLEGAVSVKSRKTGKTHLVTAGHTIFIHR
jgi:hypothetical protein